MVENPLCPDCKKQMTPRFVCTHCGYDTQAIHTATNRRIMSMPYNCAKCGNPTAKKVEDIPVCGDCFVEGWGRLPDMPLIPETKPMIVTPFHTIVTEEAPLYVSDKPPKPKAAKRKSKPGGTRK